MGCSFSLPIFDRSKRKTRGEDDDKWECSVCTYINPSESYKCEICFMRKGTSTRKPRLNPQVVEQQQLIAQAILKEKDDENRKKKERFTDKQTTSGNNVKLKNFDRNAPLLFEIFANGYSVVITEFQLKSKVQMSHFPDSPAPSTCSSLQGFSGTPNIHPEQLSPVDSNPSVDNAISRGSHVGSYEFDFNDPNSTASTAATAHTDSKHRLSSMSKPFPLSKSTPHNPSGYDPVHPTRSHSSASSSIGGTNISRPSSPHAPPPSTCLTEVKREPEALLKVEQLADYGDDEAEGEEEEEENREKSHNYRTRTWRVPSQARRTKLGEAMKSENGATNIALRSTDCASASALASSRPRRQHPRIDGPNPYVLPGSSSNKRRKLNPSCYHSKLSIHGRRNVLEITKHVSPHSNTASPSGVPMKIDADGFKRRINSGTAGLNGAALGTIRETRTSKRKSARHTRRSSSSRTRHESSNKPALKCRIRVPRSSLPLPSSPPTDLVESNETKTDEELVREAAVLPSANSETRSVTSSVKEAKDALDATGDVSSACTNRPNPDVGSTANLPVRLSSESKNTSAMTDSSGASALEISQ